jgi:hypothetical protein
VIGITATLLPSRIAVAAETRTFYATVVGDEAVPPVATAAHAALTAGLDDEGRRIRISPGYLSPSASSVSSAC